MNKWLLTLLCLLPLGLLAQSKTTNAIEKKFDAAFTLYFYKNTLRMLNQTDSKEFDEMIKNIEKMKFILVDKTKVKFEANEYSTIKKNLTAETYESIMTSRFDGRNMDVFLKDKPGSPLGTVVLVNDSTNLYVLDILGTIDIRKASTLFNAIDGSTEIGKKIKSFADGGSQGGLRGPRKHVKVD